MVGRSLRATAIGLTFAAITDCACDQRRGTTADESGMSARPSASAVASSKIGVDGKVSQSYPALYALRGTEMHAGSPEGPIIGRALRGAMIFAANHDAGKYVSFALPGFTNGALGDSGVWPAIVAFAPADAFGQQAAEPERPEPQGRLVEDFPPGVEIALVPGGEPFAVTRCDDIRVLEIQGQSSRISQWHAGFELSGWLAAPIEVSRGPLRCKLRVIYRRDSKLIAREGLSPADEKEISEIPPEYVRPDDQEILLDIIDKSKIVYWLTRTETMGTRCTAWRFSRRKHSRQAAATDEALEGRLTGTPIMRGNSRVVPSFDWEYKMPRAGRAGELLLRGPHFHTPAGTPLAGYRCTNAFTTSGRAEHAVRMFPSNWTPERVAWHPDDEERWFDSKEACEQTARAAEPMLKSGVTRPPGGLHVSCSGESD